MRRGSIWLIDATAAFIIVLVMVQLCLLWMAVVVDSTVSFHSHAAEQKRLIDASDRLINDPNCLAMVDYNHVVPQTLDTRRLNSENLVCNLDVNYSVYNIAQNHDGLVVRRLVFLNEEGGEVGVLEVW